MHNEVFQSAQVVRCLDERLTLAAWARTRARTRYQETRPTMTLELGAYEGTI